MKWVKSQITSTQLYVDILFDFFNVFVGRNTISHLTFLPFSTSYYNLHALIALCDENFKKIQAKIAVSY